MKKATLERGLFLFGDDDRSRSDAGELLLLEAFPAEYRTSLSGSERYSGFLAARRAIGRRFDTFTRHPAASRRASGALGLTPFAAFGLVLEVFVGEEVLFARGPHEFRAAIYATEQLVLELHRPLPLNQLGPPFLSTNPGYAPGAEGAGRPPGVFQRYSDSRRCFLRVRLRASACFARRRSPGFR